MQVVATGKVDYKTLSTHNQPESRQEAVKRHVPSNKVTLKPRIHHVGTKEVAPRNPDRGSTEKPR